VRVIFRGYKSCSNLPQVGKKLSEIDICDLFISPAIKAAGWDQLTQIRREVTLAPGPITGGNIASRNKKKKKFADYVLYQEPNVPIGVVERAGSTRPSSSLPSLTGFLEMSHSLAR
jgi:type I restriction enzyme R subunit